MQVRNALALAAAAALIAGGAVAVGAHAAAAGAGIRGQQLAGATVGPRTAAPDDGAVGSTFVVVAPCRVVDTRTNEGAIAKGGTSAFTVTGLASLASQGGSSSGCGIPVGATSVSATVIAVGATGGGFLRGYATRSAVPTSSFLNFVKGTTSTAAVLPVSAGSTGQVSIEAEGSSTNVVIDVTGYTVPPLAAFITSAGHFTQGSRVSASVHLATGTYSVQFPRDVSGCYYSVTSYNPAVTVNAQPEGDSVNEVFVYTAVSGKATDESFYLVVTC